MIMSALKALDMRTGISPRMSGKMAAIICILGQPRLASTEGSSTSCLGFMPNQVL